MQQEESNTTYTPTENARIVLERRYLQKDSEGNLIEKPDEMMHRVANAIASVENAKLQKKYSRYFYDILAGGMFLPNSPTLMNAGTKTNMLSACISGDTYIYTRNKGLVYMRDVKKGDEVLTHKGRFRKVKRHWSNGYKLINRLAYGKKTVKQFNLGATPDHKIYTEEGNWVRSDQLTDNFAKPFISSAETKPLHYFNMLNYLHKINKSYKVIDKHVRFLNRNPKLFGEYDKQIKPVKSDIRNNSNLAKIFGIYVANGNIDKHTLRVCFNKDKRDDIVEFLSLFYSVFGMSPSVIESNHGNWVSVNISSKIICNLFRANFKEKFNSKRLPEWIFAMGDSYVLSFLEGVKQDGHELESGSFKITLANPTLVYQLVLLYRNRDVNLKCKFISHAEVELSKNPTSAVYFSRDTQHTLHKLVRDTTSLSTEVFDMEVEDDHSFVAGDFVVHNCFTLPIADNMEDILETVKNTGIIFKLGGGVGINFSSIRPLGSFIHTTGGYSSGPVSFMRIFDTLTKVIAQGGKRRGALMGILNVEHPDIISFINAKIEDKKLTGFNLSVGITDAFIKQVLLKPNRVHQVTDPSTKKKSSLVDKNGKQVTVKQLFDLITQRAWESGEPGIILVDRLQEYNPIPHLRIDCTNPCSIGSTLVATPSGYRRSDEIKEGERINTVLGSGLVDKVEFHDNVPVYEVEFTDGGRVTVTKAHQFHAIKIGTKKYCNKFDCISLEDLSVGDWVRLSPTSLPNNSFNFIGDSVMTERNYGILLGVLLGDGCLAPRTISNNVVKIAYNKEDRDWKAALEELLSPIVESFSYDESKDSNSANLCVYGKDSTLLNIVKSEKIISKSNKRRIPKRVIDSNENILKGLLSGLFSTDGNVNQKANYPQIRYTTASRELVCDIRCILLMFGICCSMYEKNSPSKIKGREIKNNPRYEITIAGASLKTFYDKIGFIRSYKQDKLINLVNNYSLTGNIWRTKIKSVTYVGEEKVYDLYEPKSDTWITNGYVSRGCGEVPLPPHGSCTLGSINLSKFVNIDGSIDYQQLHQVINLAVRFLDNVISLNDYPLPQIHDVSTDIRGIGLGVMGFADTLFKLKIPYNSDEGVAFADKIMRFVNQKAHEYSEILGQEKGNFPLFEKSIWKDKYKFHRNGTVSVIAPTGSISKIAGCSGGIEPLFSPIFKHVILDMDELLEVSPFLKTMLSERDVGLSAKEMKQIHEEGTVQNIDAIPEDIKKIFTCSHDVSPIFHLKMQEAFQKHTDCSVSKTINLPHDATVEVVRDIYKTAFKSKVIKGLTVYRDGSRMNQPMQLDTHSKTDRKKSDYDWFLDFITAVEKKGNISPAVKIRQSTPFGTLHVTLVFDKKMNEHEVFAQLGKSGDVIGADLEAICRLSSKLLQSKFKFDDLIKQLVDIGTSLSLPTAEGKVVSLPDGLAKALNSYKEVKLEVLNEKTKKASKSHNGDLYKVKCPSCDSGHLVYSEGCCHCDTCEYELC